MIAVFLSREREPKGGAFDLVGYINFMNQEELIGIVLRFIRDTMADPDLRDEAHRGDYSLTLLDTGSEGRYAAYVVFEDGGQLIDIYPNDEPEGHWIANQKVNSLPFRASYTNVKPKPKLTTKESAA